MKLKGIELKGTYEVEFDDMWFEVYDDKDNRIYYEDSDGYWTKNEYDERDNLIYYEDSAGNIVDNRVKELTVDDIEKLLGYKIKVKIDEMKQRSQKMNKEKEKEIVNE